MRLLFFILLIGAGIYFYMNRPDLENGSGGPVTLAMRSEEVLKNAGKPAQLHTERGGREVWIYEDGRLVELRDHEVIRSEAPAPGKTWVRLDDGSWVANNAIRASNSGLTKAPAKGPALRGSETSLKAREQWGWDRQGTALDQPAKPAK